jgi:hypothetical protein
VQAVVFAVLGVALLAAPGLMVEVWPWPITSELAQFYAGPVLAYAYCSWRYGMRRTWLEVATVVPAMLALTTGTVVVSVLHGELFSASDVADWIWFIGFGAAAAVLAAMCAILLSVALRPR